MPFFSAKFAQSAKHRRKQKLMIINSFHDRTCFESSFAQKYSQVGLYSKLNPFLTGRSRLRNSRPSTGLMARTFDPCSSAPTPSVEQNQDTDLERVEAFGQFAR